ncbi:ABC transporter permease [archaeon]|jgi:putative ABC transport system permease protein|nr:ABC transporter permease [archaeon]
MIQDYFFLAVKNLKHRGARSWLTLLGIFIGVTAVVALISLGNALQFAVSSQFGISDTEIITVQAGGISGQGPPGSNVVNPLTTADLEAIQRLSSVKLAVARNIENGKLEYNDKLIFGYAVNIPSGEARDFIYEQLDQEPISGRFLKDSDVGKVFLGYNFYVDKVGLEKEVIPGKTILIQDEDFEVVGVSDKKGSLIFDNAVYLNDKDLEELFDYGDEVNAILVQPVNKKDMDGTVEDIEKLLRKRRDIKRGEDDDFEASTPEASLATVNGVIGGVQAFIVIVALISVFIGAIGIVNTMTTSVLERKKEIGIMKAIGARNEHVFSQFFVESGLLGLVGGIVGIIFGTLIGFGGTMAINNWIGSEIGISLNFGLIFFALLGSFLIGAVSGIVPAMNASKEDPVTALRG